MELVDPVKTENIFDNIPADLHEEFIETLTSRNGIRIERIVSRGHASPPDYWYDQELNEYVILLKGSAELFFEDNDHPVTMRPGDWINIRAHQKHRVVETDAAQDTIWLAVHY